MKLHDELLKLIGILKGRRYLLVGGLAYSIYAEPRFTRDVDFLINETDFEGIRELLGRKGFLPQKKIIKFKTATIGRCTKVIRRDVLIVDFLLKSKEEFDVMYERRTIVRSGRIEIPVASIDDLIAIKRLRNSKIDESDIENLERVKKERKKA